MATYTFYDIPTAKGAECWSPNTWKGRAILNYKKIPYTTEWVEYPDIASVLKDLGLPPLDDDPPYTLPLLKVQDKETKLIRESDDIVKYVNSLPGPTIDIDSDINNALRNVKNKAGPAIGGLIIPVVPNYLAEKSSEYFHRTRSVYFGCTLAEFRQRKIDQGVWGEMEAWAKEVSGLLHPFFSDKPCAVDIQFFGILKWFDVTGNPEDFKKIMGFGGPKFEEFYEAAKQIYGQSPDGEGVKD